MRFALGRVQGDMYCEVREVRAGYSDKHVCGFCISSTHAWQSHRYHGIYETRAPTHTRERGRLNRGAPTLTDFETYSNLTRMVVHRGGMLLANERRGPGRR